MIKVKGNKMLKILQNKLIISFVKYTVFFGNYKTLNLKVK